MTYSGFATHTMRLTIRCSLEMHSITSMSQRVMISETG